MTDNITILIVDDDPDILFATSRIVKSMDYKVLNASSGAECRKMVKQYHPGIILLDVVLPDMDGPELCRELKTDPASKNIFIILISGMKTSSEEQAGGLNVGADGYIARPVSNRELKARINAFVRIIKAERDRDRLIAELEKTLSDLKRLSGLLPICMHCKNIRNDRGYWEKIEDYISQHSDAVLSHSICKECADKYYPELDIYDD